MQIDSQLFKSTKSVNSPATVCLTNKEMDIMKKEFQRLKERGYIRDISGIREKVMKKVVQLIITAKQDSKSGLKKDNYPAYALAAILHISREDDIFTRDWYYYGQKTLISNVNRIIEGDVITKRWRSLFQQAERYIGEGIQKTLVNFCESHQMTNKEFQKRYLIKKIIGKGSAGTIHLAYDNNIKREISLKIMTFEYPPGPKVRDSFNNEIKTMKILSSESSGCNPYIICLNDWHCVTPQPEAKWGWKFVINMEYIRGTTLDIFHIESDQDGERIMLQIARGLAHIHKNGIVHADLFDENILMDKEGNAKIIDFGASYSLMERCDKSSYIRHNIKTHHSWDIFFLGMIYKDLLRNKPILTDQYQTLVAEMRNINPSNRPSIEKVIQVLTESISKKIICSNQKSIQGWDIQKYRSSDLIHYREKDQTYCFLKSDVSFLQQGLNPFTGRKIGTKALEKFVRLAKEKKLFDPYGVVLPKGITTKCPLFVSHDLFIGYHYHCEGCAKFVTKSVSPGQDSESNCVGLLYQTTLKHHLLMEDMDQYGFIRAKESNIVSDKLILDLKSLEATRPLANRVLKETSSKTYPVYNSMDDDTEDLSLRDSLQEFMNSGHIVLPSQAIQDILVQKIRPSKPIILYRGLTWNEWSGLTFEKWMNQIGRKKISIGDELEIIDTRVASWSANICISSTFALGDYGIVFSYQAQPEEIMLDTRMLLDREKFYQHDQAEVMLLPGRKKNGEWGGPITRRVKVEMVVWSWGQRTPSGFLLKEKPVDQYNLWVKELIIP